MYAAKNDLVILNLYNNQLYVHTSVGYSTSRLQLEFKREIFFRTQKKKARKSNCASKAEEARSGTSFPGTFHSILKSEQKYIPGELGLAK